MFFLLYFEVSIWMSFIPEPGYSFQLLIYKYAKFKFTNTMKFLNKEWTGLKRSIKWFIQELVTSTFFIWMN